MGLFDFVGDAISAVTKPLQGIVKQATGIVTAPIKQLTGAATKMTGQAADVAKHGEDAVAHTAQAGYQAAAGAITPLTSGLGQGVSALGGGLGSMAGSVGKGVGGDFGMMLPIAAVGLGGVPNVPEKGGGPHGQNAGDEDAHGEQATAYRLGFFLYFLSNKEKEKGKWQRPTTSAKTP